MLGIPALFRTVDLGIFMAAGVFVAQGRLKVAPASAV